jgi:uncharacterized protein (TIGR00369 family)
MDREVLLAQNISRMCMVCGTENDAGLHARFLELEGGELLATFVPDERHQGYPGRLHGGIASTLLDEAIGRTVSVSDPGAWGVTLELNVRYRKPVPLDEEVRALCRIVSDGGRIFEGTGEIMLADGTVAVEARGKYMRLPIDRIAEGDFSTQWFPDERELPTSVDI